ncbi:CopD family protein [Roseobacter sp. HKCCA0434]|uniref:CopD family protein n=1 Tax=Roseobacter sp. HKCCA0434 TaxID=3079297 RepID=UPI002905D588|nr:CopD family protein [Roseobacter sp. HKCCA0434]
MIEVLVPAVPHLKALHISMLVIWCAGLFALPNLLARHEGVVAQDDYTRIRRLTHYGYIGITTPAAVLAIGSGGLLIFVREVFELWLFAKLVGVAALVTFHVWVGRTIVAITQVPGVHRAPAARLPQWILTGIVLIILTLVLAKPELIEIPVPGWLSEPRGVQLPFDVPRR